MVVSNPVGEPSEPMVEAQVIEVLTMQFIAIWPIFDHLGQRKMKRGFFLFVGRGDTWRPLG